jgi:translation initiation factor eIF-2B subunit delta
VEQILKAAWAAGTRFRVIVCDSRPKLEGRELLRRLVAAGVPCTYIYVSSLGYVIKEVTKVFVGAYACLANGAVISRVGCAVVGMMAHSHNVPVLVCCETYKFHERVQMDSICFNELGDPDHLASIGTSGNENGADESKVSPIAGWRDNSKLKLLNLVRVSRRLSLYFLLPLIALLYLFVCIRYTI